MPDEMIFKELAGAEGLCAGSSVFTRANVVAAIVDMAVPDDEELPRPLLLSADEVERLADSFLASHFVVELLPEEEREIVALRDEPVFTTAAMLATQARILERGRAGRAAGGAVVPAATLQAVLTEHAHLTAEQRQLVAVLCTSGARVQCAIGRAGTGKTTSMRAAAAAWTAAGYRVLGTAVKGEAARILGKEAQIPAETLAWHLRRDQVGNSPLDARTVLIVDEASTVSDRDLDQLLALAERTGATVRLIGDPAQHGAVRAGGMFGVLCDDDPDHTPELAESHRVVDPHDRVAAEALREGRIADALGALGAAGHLHIVDDEVDLYLDVLERWWESRRAGHEHPMVDRRNHTRWQLNRLAHRLLQATGEVGAEEIVATGDRRFSIGDRVVARLGDRLLHPPGRPDDYVRNGARGTVVALSETMRRKNHVIRVAFDGIGTVDLPRSFFDEHERPDGRRGVGLDHAYAATSYSVQGATFAESTSRIDENASRAETYVDITRGRSANHLYVTRRVDPLDGERLPKTPPPPIESSVVLRLSGSGPERTAIDVDPTAPLAAGDERRARQVARIGARSLDPSVLSRLPARSHLPFLARQWDETAAQLSVFLARWNVAPGGLGRWEWALGPRDQPAMEAERRQAEARLVDLTVATATEDLQDHGWDRLPRWAVPHLAELAACGKCRIDAAQTSGLYTRIKAYREGHGLVDDDDGNEARNLTSAVLGPVPTDPADRAAYQLLAHEIAASVRDVRAVERGIA